MYAPTADKDKEEIKTFYNHIEEVMKNVKRER